MPEGPSILILKNAVTLFKRKRVLNATGNTKKIDLKLLKGKVVRDFRSWGKHFLICFDDFFVRIHFLMFGSYSINERKRREARLRLKFTNGEVNFYSCSVRLVEGSPDDVYDWSADVMNPNWDAASAKKKIRRKKEILVCDILLDQQIFAGVGNIIKNEVLFRIRIHPANVIGNLPAGKINELVGEAVNYSFDFLKWKRKFVLKKHYLIYNKKNCSFCGGKIMRMHLGESNRRTFFCPNCQKMY